MRSRDICRKKNCELCHDLNELGDMVSMQTPKFKAQLTKLFCHWIVNTIVLFVVLKKVKDGLRKKD